MGRSLLASGRFAKVDGLVPVPLFKSRQLTRGYNQAALICEGIADQTGWKLMGNALARPAATLTQTQRNRIERWKNMEGRFELAHSDELGDKHLLLVDDVMTTGATLEACGRALLAVPGVTLSIATLAYTV
jgi:ComF family protein